MNPMQNASEMTNPSEMDAHDILATLEITKVQRRTSSGGAGVRGRMAGHRFDALVFPEHATNPEYELGDSRISKLWIQRIEDHQTVVNFDRGWDVRPTTTLAAQIADLLAAGLAEQIFGA